jgi:hypothetical protein
LRKRLCSISAINFRRSAKYGFEALVTTLPFTGPRIVRLHLPRFRKQDQKLETERDFY